MKGPFGEEINSAKIGLSVSLLFSLPIFHVFYLCHYNRGGRFARLREIQVNFFEKCKVRAFCTPKSRKKGNFTAFSRPYPHGTPSRAVNCAVNNDRASRICLCKRRSLAANGRLPHSPSLSHFSLVALTPTVSWTRISLVTVAFFKILEGLQHLRSLKVNQFQGARAFFRDEFLEHVRSIQRLSPSRQSSTITSSTTNRMREAKFSHSA